MVANAQAQSQPAAVPSARVRRQREEELLVWPDLVFIEFIAALVFLLALVALSIAINAPLLDRANPGVTPNPSKAPWYFLNLQELLLHMHPALAGVIVPTVALIALGAIPYFDRSNDYQGEWLSSPRAWPLAIVGALVGSVGSLLLIVWDSGKHVVLYYKVTHNAWPDQLKWFVNARALQNEIPWPASWRHVPLGDKILRTDLLGLPKMSLNLNIPEMIVAQMLPVGLMVGLPLIMSAILHKVGLARTKRDHMIVQFSGFIAVYVTLTVIGTAFRGQGMELLFPWDVTPPVS